MNAVIRRLSSRVRRKCSLRRAVLAVVSAVLLLGLGGAATAAAAPPRLVLPAEGPEVALAFESGCLWVPGTVTGGYWYFYCPKDSKNALVHISDANGAPMYQGFWDQEKTDDYDRLQGAQGAWLGSCEALGMAQDGYGYCDDWVEEHKAAKLPDLKSPYNATSFWDPIGNNDQSVSSPCDFLKLAAGAHEVQCIDPRRAKPEEGGVCPPDKLGPASQLLRNCETQNAEVINRFGFNKETEGADSCDSTGGEFCDYDPTDVVISTEFKDEEFLDAPIDWTAKQLRNAVATVSLWWILAPEPMIDNGENTGINVEQNVNFLVQHTNVITLSLVALSIIIASIRISLTREVRHAQDVVRSVVVLVLVSGLSVLLINAMVTASSWYSTWILVRGLDPSSDAPLSRAAGQEAATVAIQSFTADLNDLNFVLLVLLSLCLLAGGLVQWIYMIVRIPMVTILAGTLPLAAAATNTEVGKSWLSRHLTYLGAFILVKPASVTIFVASARLFSSNSASASGPEAQFRGAVILLLMSLLLPALVKMIFPIVAPATGGQAASTTMVGGVLAGGARLVKR